jgi:hypothetical protein
MWIRNAYTILIRKPERRKRPHGSPRCRWEDNIRMDLSEKEWEDTDWMHLVQDMDQLRALANTVTKLRIP